MKICAISVPEFTLIVKMHDLYAHLLFASRVDELSNAMPSVSLEVKAISFAAADESGPPQSRWHPVGAKSNVQGGPSAIFGMRFSGTLFAINIEPPPIRTSKTAAEA
jgi:hypothetical protein